MMNEQTTYRVTCEPMDRSRPKSYGREHLTYAEAEDHRAAINERAEATGETLIIGIERTDGRDPFARINRELRGIAIAAALILATLSPAAAQPIAPDGCQLAGTTGEGFPVAHCQDGTLWYADMDGQTHPAAPYVAPGTWTPMSDASPVFP